jgi:hypothetical protein
MRGVSNEGTSEVRFVRSDLSKELLWRRFVVSGSNRWSSQGREERRDRQNKRRFHGGFTSVARSASLALEESSSFSWWLATSRQPRQRACAIERASVKLSHQLI